jgi:hypothetical protein
MCQNPEESRRAVWGYTLDEMLEIIQLLRWANLQTISQDSSEATVDALFGERPVSQAMTHHLLQLLPVKIESIFGKRGGGSDEEGKEMLENKLLDGRWWKPMRDFADGAVDDAQSLRKLWNMRGVVSEQIGAFGNAIGENLFKSQSHVILHCRFNGEARAKVPIGPLPRKREPMGSLI